MPAPVSQLKAWIAKLRSTRAHELEGDSATLVPPSAIGRMLSLDEASKIIRTFDRWIPKRAAVSGRGSVAARRA